MISATQFADGLAQVLEVSNDDLSLMSNDDGTDVGNYYENYNIEDDDDDNDDDENCEKSIRGAIKSVKFGILSQPGKGEVV